MESAGPVGPDYIFFAATTQHRGTHAETRHKYVMHHAESYHMANTALACIGMSLKKSSIWPIHIVLAVHAW